MLGLQGLNTEHICSDAFISPTPLLATMTAERERGINLADNNVYINVHLLLATEGEQTHPISF